MDGQAVTCVPKGWMETSPLMGKVITDANSLQFNVETGEPH